MENLEIIIMSGVVSVVFFAFSFTLLRSIWKQRENNKSQ